MSSDNCSFNTPNSTERNRPRVVWPIGFFSRMTTSWVFNIALCGWRVLSRMNRLSLFRSTARLANFLATAIPRAPSMPWLRDPKYKPQCFDVLGFVFSNSDMRALFKRVRLDCQAFTALGTTCVQNGTAATRFHAYTESVGAFTAGYGWLICSFHDWPRESQVFSFVAPKRST